MNLADQDAITQAAHPPSLREQADLAAGLLTFHPDFQKAIAQSLATRAVVQMPIPALAIPDDQDQLDLFCKQALSSCPLSMELSFLNRRQVHVSLNWLVRDKSIVVSLEAADVTQQRRQEEAEAARQSQREIDHLVEQSQSERQLRDSEERYRASFEQAAVGILHTSFESRIIRCNRRFGEMLGFAPRELEGLSFQQITPPGDRPPSKTMFERLVSGEIVDADFEKRYVRKDGSLTWVHLTVTIQRDSEGRPLHFITMVQDINPRKQAQELLAVAQESLRKSEERYRTAFQMTMDAVVLNRLSDGLYVDCNLAFLNMSGYTREEIIGRSSTELGIWADESDRERMLETVKRNGGCSNFEAQFRKKTGGIVWGMMSASLMDVDEEPCLLTVTRDMSEAKMAENEIKRLAYYASLHRARG